MKKYILTFLFASLTWLTFAQTKPHYKLYHNTRFDFCAWYPADFKLGVAPENGDGQSFFTQNKQGKILVYGAWLQPGQDMKALYKEEQQNRKVTYKAFLKNSFVVSGWQDGLIFYQKTVLRKDAVLTLLLSYPSDQKKSFDKIITKVSKKFPTCK